MKIVDITRFKDTPLVNEDSCFFFPEFPHLHAHMVTPDDVVASSGEGICELCCHQCGDHLFIRYLHFQGICDELFTDMLVSVGEDFIEEHVDCHGLFIDGLPVHAEDFFYICPTERSENMYTIDLAEDVFDE